MADEGKHKSDFTVFDRAGGRLRRAAYASATGGHHQQHRRADTAKTLHG